jgi:hypothetical protein
VSDRPRGDAGRRLLDRHAAVDEPCLDAVDTASPVSVPDVAAAMRWPGFRTTADQLGVTASLSIPLFAGSGTAIAALNLYGRVPDSLAALTAAVWLAYDPPG